jgi:hypothetical protein
MNSANKSFVSRGCALGNPEDSVVLIRPGKNVLLCIESPSAYFTYFLGSVQVVAA